MYILHSFWNLDAEQRHTVLQNLSHVGCKNQTGNLLSLALGIQESFNGKPSLTEEEIKAAVEHLVGLAQ